MESRLGTHLLLLVQRDLVVELLQQQVWVVQDAGARLSFLGDVDAFEFCLLSQIFFLLGSDGRQLVIVVVPVEELLD